MNAVVDHGRVSCNKLTCVETSANSLILEPNIRIQFYSFPIISIINSTPELTTTFCFVFRWFPVATILVSTGC